MWNLDIRIRLLRDKAESENSSVEAANRYDTVCKCPPPEKRLTDLVGSPDHYRYTSKPAPCQEDAVIRDIKRVIRDLNIQRIGFADMDFRVVPTDNSFPSWITLPDYTTYCGKKYTFLDDYNEFPLTAWVTFFPALAIPIAENLRLEIGNKGGAIARVVALKNDTGCATGRGKRP